MLGVDIYKLTAMHYKMAYFPQGKVRCKGYEEES